MASQVFILRGVWAPIYQLRIKVLAALDASTLPLSFAVLKIS